MAIAITIDGTAGTGKTLLAKNIEKRIKGVHYSTGVLYRKYGYLSFVLETQEVSVLQDHLHQCDEGPHLKTEKVAERASLLASYKHVRDAVVYQQQKDIRALLDQNNHVVLDGRDAGSAVWPLAECKFFLAADPSVCWQRRMKELNDDSAHVRAMMEKRDSRDKGRAESPLIVPEGGIVIDANGSPEEVFEKAWAEITRKL